MKDSTILIVSLEREDLHVYRLLHTLMLAKVCLKNLSTTSLNYFYGPCRPPPYKYYFGKVKHNKMQNAIDATSPHSGGATPIQIPSHEPMPELADVKLFQAMDRKAKLFFQSESSKLDKLKDYALKLVKQGVQLKNIEELKTYDIPAEILANLSVDKVLLQSQSRFQRMAKTSKIKRNWSLGDLTILLWLIAVYSETQSAPLAEIHNDPSCWKFVNDLITCTTPEQCLFRWMGFKKYRVTEFAWSDEEDYLLKSLEKKHRDHPSKWKVLAEQLYKLNPSTEKIYRQAKQCKQHFNSFLDPTIKKGLWSKQEDLLLFSAYLKFGCRRRWCLINKFFTNRTENSLKNRFQLLHNRLMNDAVQPSDEPIIIRKYVDGLRTQIRKLEMEDQLVLKADELLRESAGAKMEEEDTPQREVEMPSLSKIVETSKVALEEKKQSQIVVKAEEVEEIVMCKADIIALKGESLTNLPASNFQMEQQAKQLHSSYTGYTPVEFFDGQTMQTIAFPYFNGFYSLPFYQFSSATNIESSAPAASEAFQQSL